MLKLFARLFPLLMPLSAVDGSDNGGAATPAADAGAENTGSEGGTIASGVDSGAQGASGGAEASTDGQTPQGGSVEAAQAAIKEGLANANPAAAAANKAAADAALEADPVKKAAADKAAADTKAADDAKIKATKVDDIKLTDAEKAALTPKAHERFHTLHKVAKANEDALVVANAQLTELRTRSEALTNIMKETQTGPEELGALLDYNRMLKTGQFDDALALVEQHRAAIYKAMGREAPGVDLLADFPDLAARVERNEITRGDAIELGNNRRREAVRQQQENGQRQQQQHETQTLQQQQNALGQIEKWCNDTAQKDVDFKAREAKLMPQIEQIMQQYPSHLWLPTIQRLYETVSVPRETTFSQQTTPLRPNGAKPGPKAPASMFDAIRGGLGYSAGV